jgi:hypothetical protein
VVVVYLKPAIDTNIAESLLLCQFDLQLHLKQTQAEWSKMEQQQESSRSAMA